jgi:predicted RNA-binding Zn-ribbon protein involved in translation (DUF1610 family)
MRYILHYTEPGDIVFDGFCGTGMTGVAAQMCGDRATVESLGYQVELDGMILRQEKDKNGKSVWVPFSKLGARRAVLNDLSPAATFIAYNYNTPVDVAAFGREAKRILEEIEEKYVWLYETKHTDGRLGRVNYIVWSDVFICPECAREIVFWDVALDKSQRKLNSVFPCPHCAASLSKTSLDHAWVSRFDTAVSKTVKQTKRVPVLINYSVGAKRYEKKPDTNDLDLIERINRCDLPYWFPINSIKKGDKTVEPIRIGFTHAHHFYTKRNLLVLSALWERSKHQSLFRLSLTSILIKTASLLHNIGLKNGKINLAGALPNAIYIPSNLAERNIIELLRGKISDIARAGLELINNSNIVFTASSDTCFRGGIPDNSVDYIFVDPPFGSNLMYSELNFIWEAWLGVFTENEPEAIVNRTQQKNLEDYRHLMTGCFSQAHRVLKPGRWMTVEFSNTKANVWNSIQTALQEAGFVVANVAALNKGQGTFNSQTNPTSVKQDLVITAYKPNGGFEERFPNEATTEEGVWDFIRTHLKYLPVIKKQGGNLVPVPERDPRILFDQMVAYYVRKGYPVPISSQEFQLGLVQRFPERDGMYFLPDQAAEYDRKKMLGGGKQIQMSLFVSDEASAITWLRNLIRQKPQSFQDINPLFMKEIGGWQKHEKPLELSEMLEQNFLRYDGKGEVPSQIHSYLSSNFKELRNLHKDAPALRAKAKDRWYVPDPNKAGDLEKLRERALMREFEEYRESKQKRLKVFRLEAVRAGFKKAWQERDYATIIGVARKIPNKILQEDPKLLMWYDQAVTRMGDTE